MVKIVCISDTHGSSAQNAITIPECDILIHSGDATQSGKNWQFESFAMWFGAQTQCEHKIFVPGNHDFICEENPDLSIEMLDTYGDIHYLDQELVVLEELNIYGEPRQPWFHDWAFNVHRPDMQKVWEKVPKCTDVLVTHGPPFGFGDINRGGQHVGCGWQKELLEKSDLKLIACGHIHTGYGVYKHGDTHIINSSICNDRKKPTNNPIVIEIIP